MFRSRILNTVFVIPRFYLFNPIKDPSPPRISLEPLLLFCHSVITPRDSFPERWIGENPTSPPLLSRRSHLNSQTVDSFTQKQKERPYDSLLSERLKRHSYVPSVSPFLYHRSIYIRLSLGFYRRGVGVRRHGTPSEVPRIQRNSPLIPNPFSSFRRTTNRLVPIKPSPSESCVPGQLVSRTTLHTRSHRLRCPQSRLWVVFCLVRRNLSRPTLSPVIRLVPRKRFRSCYTTLLNLVGLSLPLFLSSSPSQNFLRFLRT